VVSGLARGVDGAAHVGALEGSSVTLAVMGSGLSVVYPEKHKPLAEDVTRRGAVISELPPWARAYARHFPLRNRIISGLSKAVVVVEANERSGSLITARMAYEQSRDVLAVPGCPMSGCHKGCHALIKDGARLVETVDDVLDEIGWRPSVTESSNSPNRLQLSDLEANMAMGEAYSVDELALRTGRDVAQLLPELGMLELSGRVTRLGGGHFARFPSRQ
jgi:DNA processing protein